MNSEGLSLHQKIQTKYPQFHILCACIGVEIVDPILNSNNPVIVVLIGDGALLTKGDLSHQLIMDVSGNGDIGSVHRIQSESLALIYDWSCRVISVSAVIKGI